MITARRATALLLTAAAALGLMALLLMPNPGTAAHATPAPTSASLAAQAAPAASGGTGVSAELDARAAFLADLTDGAATDLDPATADDLVADAHRICDLHQPHADWLAAHLSPHRRSPGLPLRPGLRSVCDPGGVPHVHDPEPPARDLTCARCGHGWPQHAHPGGGHCLWWDPAQGAGSHCSCPAFQYVSPWGDTPSTPS
jgi:hypothetical protein